MLLPVDTLLSSSLEMLNYFNTSLDCGGDRRIQGLIVVVIA
jgi:hypothetical protein